MAALLAGLSGWQSPRELRWRRPTGRSLRAALVGGRHRLLRWRRVWRERARAGHRFRDRVLASAGHHRGPRRWAAGRRLRDRPDYGDLPDELNARKNATAGPVAIRIGLVDRFKDLTGWLSE